MALVKCSDMVKFASEVKADGQDTRTVYQTSFHSKWPARHVPISVLFLCFISCFCAVNTVSSADVPLCIMFICDRFHCVKE